MAFEEKLEQQLDKEKLTKLCFRVFALERENHSTRKLKDNEMVDKIIKHITTEVENDN